MTPRNSNFEQFTVQGCSLSIEVIIKSSDGRLIGAHSMNLAAYSEGFPPACFSSPETVLDPVELTEKSDLIRRKFLQFSANQVKDIAYAAEKYLIYLLMEVWLLQRFAKRLTSRVNVGKCIMSGP
jgi:hypothetical protein